MPTIRLSSSILRLGALYLFLFILLLACESSEKDNTSKLNADKPAVLQLQDKGLKTLTIGEFVNNDQLQALQFNRINNTDYLSYYDNQTHALYLHEYPSGRLIKTIQLKNEGPDKVIIFLSPKFYIHTLDSIYINTNFSGYYLIDSNGKVLLNANKRTSGFRGEDMNVLFDESSYQSNTGIHGTIRWKSSKLTEHFPFAHGSLNFETGKLTTSAVRTSAILDDYEEIMDFWKKAKKEKKLYRAIRLQSIHHADELLMTSNISDSISVFKNDQLVKRIYAGMPAHPVADYLTYLQNGEIIMGKKGASVKNDLNKQGSYENTLMDPTGRFIYRILVHGTKPGISKQDGAEIPVLIGATLIVIDRTTEKRYDYDLPTEDINIWGSPFAKAFVSEEGIHFTVKEQDVEDEVQFRVFGIANAQ